MQALLRRRFVAQIDGLLDGKRYAIQFTGEASMLFPIAKVPITIEFREDYCTPSVDPPAGELRHRVTTLRSVWRRIPRLDQDIMIADIKEYDNQRLTVYFVKGWRRCYDTNAFIKARTDGVIAIDEGYAAFADSKHLGATIAHELAHYRDFAGDNDSALTEPVARQIAEGNWGFPRGEVIYRCERCRMIDAALRKRGITGGVFWYEEFDCFAYIKHGRRIRLRDPQDDLYLLDRLARNSLYNVLWSDLIPSFESPEARGRFMRRRIKRKKMG